MRPLRLAWLLLLLALPAGCGGGGERRESGRGELVVGAGEDVSPSGAFQARLGVYPLNVGVAEPLTRLSPDFRVEPLLATRWEYRGESTWRFHLRRGVRFHDGQPFTAAAVRASLEQALRGGYGYSGVRAVTVVDDSTVDVRTAEPNLRLPEQLVHPNYSIFAPGTDPGRLPVGTGPFRWVAYRPKEHIRVVRNEEYWGEPARLERITFRFLPDPTTRVMALLAGEVDLIMDLPREQVGTVAERSGLEVVRAPVGQMLSLHLNSRGSAPHELLSEPGVRRAVALAIDRRGLVRQVWHGEGEEGRNMTVPAVLGRFAGRVHGFRFAPAQAERLLDSLGWRVGADGVRRKGGRELRLVLLANPDLDAGTAEYVQAQLRRVGMAVSWVRLPDSGSYAARLNEGAFDLNLSTPNQNDANPLFLPALLFHSRSERPFARWHRVGERFDRLVEAGLRAGDPAEAQRWAAEAIRVAVDEEAVAIPVAGRSRLYGLRSDVEGFVPHPSQTSQSWARVHFHDRR